jgi:hypothetical protein
MLPELTAKALMQQEKLDPALYSMQLEMQLPFGIYISKAYITRNPESATISVRISRLQYLPIQS